MGIKQEFKIDKDSIIKLSNNPNDLFEVEVLQTNIKLHDKENL